MNKPVLNAGVFGGRKVIDVDTHLVEPHDLWTKRAPAKFKERVPQVKVVDGVRSWVIDGDKILLKGAIPASTGPTPVISGVKIACRCGPYSASAAIAKRTFLPPSFVSIDRLMPIDRGRSCRSSAKEMQRG